MEPGLVPQVQNVLKYPGQQDSEGQTPSVILYSNEGRVELIGSDAISDFALAEASARGWFKAERFVKLQDHQIISYIRAASRKIWML